MERAFRLGRDNLPATFGVLFVLLVLVAQLGGLVAASMFVLLALAVLGVLGAARLSR